MIFSTFGNAQMKLAFNFFLLGISTISVKKNGKGKWFWFAASNLLATASSPLNKWWMSPVIKLSDNRIVRAVDYQSTWDFVHGMTRQCRTTITASDGIVTIALNKWYNRYHNISDSAVFQEPGVIEWTSSQIVKVKELGIIIMRPNRKDNYATLNNDWALLSRTNVASQTTNHI